MANRKHLAILKQGVEAWNAWREEREKKPNLKVPDLQRARLSGANLSSANLSKVILAYASLDRANLSKANLVTAHLSEACLWGSRLSAAKLSDANLSATDLRRVDLSSADLSGADLSRADMSQSKLAGAVLLNAKCSGADLSDADLSGADLSGANLSGANLSGANLSGANLTEVILERATLVRTTLRGARIRNCRIFAASVWGVDLKEAVQEDLILTSQREPTITVDNLEVAQFIYLLLHNQKIREVIDTITSKVVLILGRFTPERKTVLDWLREELRHRDLLPVLFDFEGPDSRDVTETVSTLAHMAYFVIADLTDPRSIPQELQKIVPQLPSVAVQPILHASQEPWGMFPHFQRYPWVLPPYRYDSLEQLAEALDRHVVEPAVRKAAELRTPPA